ncbi:N-acetylmuramoyl-L-alanine amidase [Lacticigenium naphthae]|uniref:N-acetylmuramoyl-L-alanine amidase n=1 Tax=Lacticigenium naphthae TaxID=515351 RepID=UPI00041D7542|nr:N-acetylmuramoyl-L-alanine amidase [Lacticigenium naphthae]
MEKKIRQFIRLVFLSLFFISYINMDQVYAQEEVLTNEQVETTSVLYDENWKDNINEIGYTYKVEIVSPEQHVFSEPHLESNEISYQTEWKEVAFQVKATFKVDDGAIDEWLNIYLNDEEIGWIKATETITVEEEESANLLVEDEESFEVSENKNTEGDSISKTNEVIADTNSLAIVQEEKIAVTDSVLDYAVQTDDGGWVYNGVHGDFAGTVGKSKQIKGLKTEIDDSLNLAIEISTYTDGIGWSEWGHSEITNENLKISAVRLRLIGEESEEYNLFYRVHSQSYGWLDWANNEQPAGVKDYDKHIEAIDIDLAHKDEVVEEMQTTEPFIVNEYPKLTYQSHVQKYGWMDIVQNGTLSGTINESKRIEAIQLDIMNTDKVNVQYSILSENNQWSDWHNEGEIAGSIGQSKKIQAIKIRLSGEDSGEFDVYYRVHAQKFGWLDWTKNGETAGTEGFDYRLEAIEVSIKNKKDNSLIKGDNPFKKYVAPSITYKTHIQKLGWLEQVEEGMMSGTTGQEKRMEAIEIFQENFPANSSIEYTAHIEKVGWTDYYSNGSTAGTVGLARRLEGIQVRLTGEMSQKYDVYYRTHIESYGWLGWTKNGMKSGSEGLAKRIEAIEVKLFKKGTGPELDKKSFERPVIVYIDSGHGGNDSGATSAGIYEKNLNFSVTQKVVRMLKDKKINNRPITIQQTRLGDQTYSLKERSLKANTLKPDIFLSIHHNAFNGTVKGIETYYYNQSGTTNNPLANDFNRILESSKLANAIHANVVESSGAKAREEDRGVRQANFHVLRETLMPSALIEFGYIDNPTERARLVQNSYQEKLARGYVNGILEYLY